MTKDEIIEMANEAGNGDEEWSIIAKQLFKHFPEETQRFAKLVAQHEREACANVCDEYDNGRHANAADLCATTIRARGQEGDVGITRYADISVGRIIHNSPPPQRQWVGLTDEEISAIAWNFKVDSQVIRLVELEVMERNL